MSVISASTMASCGSASAALHSSTMSYHNQFVTLNFACESKVLYFLPAPFHDLSHTKVETEALCVQTEQATHFIASLRKSSNA
jgi:hypothetical protein